MKFEIRDVLLPYGEGSAVDRGWPEETGAQPWGVTWHWTATWNLMECRDLIGQEASAGRKGHASAHYAVGRSFAEGVDRYVSLEDRSWHAGREQLLCWDGSAFTGAKDKGARTTIGIETVNIGYARRHVTAGRDWIAATAPNGRWRMRIQPWTEDQIEMMIAVGQEVQERWPHLRPEDHHGHSDLCPEYKTDPMGMPFARVLRGIYGDPEIPDIWTPFLTLNQRREALKRLGYDVSSENARGWREAYRVTLQRFQRDHGLVENGLWTVFVSRRAHALLVGQRVEPAEE